MRYEEPRMEVLELEAEDVVTSSLTDGGISSENPDDKNESDTGNKVW